MRRVTLRSLWEHKRRLLSTVLAVVLGVAFMSGTFIISSTLDHSFDDLFGQVVKDVDVLVQGKVVFNDLLAGDQRANLPTSVVARVKRLPGVAAAAPHVSTQGLLAITRVLGKDGKPIGGPQSGAILENWMDVDSVNPYHLVSGRAPSRPFDVVMNVGAAEEGGLHIGDVVQVLAPSGKVRAHLVGTFALGTAKSAGGAVTIGLRLVDAQKVINLPGQIHSVWVKADPGTSPAALIAKIQPVVGAKVQAITGTEAAKQLSGNSQSSFKFLKVALTIFGAIALLVGTFVISNTFSILVAQRTKELALLRALGASRSQVLWSVLLEASVVGGVSAVAGLGGGLLLAKGVMGGLRATGARLPNTAVVIAPNTILVALVIGLAVTLLASLLPAIRATRVPPLAALRDVAIDRSNLSKGRVLGGFVALVVGAFNLSSAWTSSENTSGLPRVGAGAGLVILGFLIIGPVLAGRSVRVIGIPLIRSRGVTGRLSTENAARSPKRTSATASSIVIGVTLVVFITVFAASATKSVRSQVERGVSADFIISGKQQGLAVALGIPANVATTARKVPGVDTVSSLGFGSLRVDYPDGATATHIANAVDPVAVRTVFHPRMQVGKVTDLTDAGIILDTLLVQGHKLHLGDQIVVTGPGGASAKVRLQGVSDDKTLLRTMALTTTTFKQVDPQVVDVQVGGTVVPGADPAKVIKDLSRALKDVPGVQVLDRDGFVGSIIKQISSFITLIYGLLVLSIITALIGIANTLSLSISERTRELGLLRAIGMDRTGVKSLVRWEAFLISALGAGVGVSLGMLVSVGLVKAMKAFGLASFAFPTGGLVIVVVATIALGTLASLRPARRAAGLSILDAIATE